MKGSTRLASLGSYAFAEVDNLVASLRSQGIEPIDFGVGDPVDPTPSLVRSACKAGVDERAAAGYPSYVGASEYRDAVAAWAQRRFGLSLDPATEITSTIGAKEAVFHLPLAFVNPGEYTVSPNPYYPPYERGTLFAGGHTHFLPLDEERGYQADLSAIPDDVLARTRILWLNYPSNPTGALASKALYKEAVDLAVDHDIILVSDECYSEMYYDVVPHSALEYGYENVLVVQSLSKRSNMTNYRVGWVMGDRDAVSLFRKVKTNIDSGTPTFVQDAAIAALSDERHVSDMREGYRRKRDILCRALSDAGYPACVPEATFYIWQRVPEGLDGVEVAKRLLDPSLGIVATPGAWIAKEVDGHNPGTQYLRFALVPSIDACAQAAEKIRGADSLHP